MMHEIARKIDDGIRLSEADALFLFEHGDLAEVGRLADRVNRQKNQDVVYYNVNRHINPTNICTQSCRFCAYAKKPGQEGAYEYSIDEILIKAEEVVKQGATEVHMVGGLHPRWKFQHYVDMVSALKNKFPSLHIKAFTAVELDWMAKKDRRPVQAILEDLKAAGLGSLPGGGAEIFHQDVRDQICAKSTAERWLEIHQMAHEMGLHSNCTMLYGHVEEFKHRVDHMSRLRELQDKTHGFNAFIPLSFQPEDNDMGIKRYTLGYDDLKTIAIARLFLDNFNHIKAYWIMLGQDIAQIALNFGANDLDGTVTEEKISKAAGGRSGIVLSKRQIAGLIRKAGKIPCERDTLYNPIEKITRPVQNESAHDMILYKAEKGAALSLDEEDLLFSSANLFELESLTHPRTKKFNLFPHFIYADAIDEDDQVTSYSNNMLKKVDVVRGESKHQLIFCYELRDIFSDWEQPSFDFLISSVKHIKKHTSGLNISIRGIKQLWKMSRSLPGGFAEALANLREAGVTHLGSSILENEYDLTESEYHETALAILQNGFYATLKAQLNASMGHDGEVFWDAYTRRLHTIRSIATQHPNFNFSLIVDCDLDCPITPVEFLKALTIAQYLCGKLCKIETQMRGIPVFQKGAKKWQATENNPAMKYAPLVYHFGAEQIGGIDLEFSDNDVLLSEIVRSNIEFVRDAHAPTLVQVDREPLLT